MSSKKKKINSEVCKEEKRKKKETEAHEQTTIKVRSEKYKSKLKLIAHVGK